VSRFTDASRQAARYRARRVLLAGDAAHIHLPAGGPGLNTGLQDAANLGWKLAAEVRGWAPPGLLDTYHAERYAEGARVLLRTRAQGALMGSGADGRVAGLREVLGQLPQYEQPLRHLLNLMYALDTRYDTRTADPHPRRRPPDPARRVRGLGRLPGHPGQRRAAPGPHHLVRHPGHWLTLRSGQQAEMR
jgi:flavin-dependent dehydrogenase